MRKSSEALLYSTDTTEPNNEVLLRGVLGTEVRQAGSLVIKYYYKIDADER